MMRMTMILGAVITHLSASHSLFLLLDAVVGAVGAVALFKVQYA